MFGTARLDAREFGRTVWTSRPETRCSEQTAAQIQQKAGGDLYLRMRLYGGEDFAASGGASYRIPGVCGIRFFQ